MQCSQARERPFRRRDLSGDKPVNCGGLSGNRRHGVNQEMGNSRLASDPEKGSRGTVAALELNSVVKPRDAFHCFRCDGFRVDMAVRVKYAVHG